MSLLMDALQRAEASKQAAYLEGLSLSPQPPVAPPPHPHSPPPSGAFVSAAPPLPQPGHGALYANPAPLAPPPPLARRWLLPGGLLLALLALAFYAGWQWQRFSPLSLALPGPAASVPPAAPPAIPPAAPAAVSLLAAEPAAASASDAGLKNVLLVAPLAGDAEARPVLGETRQALPPKASSAVRLKRRRPETPSHVAQGYRLLQVGALDTASREYELALRQDPRNVDALLGLAAIAQRQGQTALAGDYYQQAAEVDPKDASAQAALIAAVAPADPAAAESRLKTLLAAQPESGPLHFALGNLHARQARWPEAQEAYFAAVAADPENPDYLFNLAVSLDHLRQARPAAQHYRLALEAAQQRPAVFDRQRVEKRLAQLPP